MKNYTYIGIPGFIKHLHPKLNLKQYEACKSNQEFLLRTLKSCEECYLMATEYSRHDNTKRKKFLKVHYKNTMSTTRPTNMTLQDVLSSLKKVFNSP